MITRDETFRNVPHGQQDPTDVQGLDEWVQHPDVKLDNPVSKFRSVLNVWVKQRQAKQNTGRTEATEYIDGPSGAQTTQERTNMARW